MEAPADWDDFPLRSRTDMWCRAQYAATIDHIRIPMKGVQMKSAIVLCSAILGSALCCLAAGNGLVGVWFNQEKDAKIEMYPCGDKYCGKIVWLKRPVYAAGSKEGTPGSARTDDKNPDPALKKAPLLGLVIVRDLVFVGDNVWKNGKVYDPDNGKTYSAKMTLVSPRQLNLRGFVGVSLLGRTAVWTKAD
jgi:uncharacterized protein (DUF2147 family)